MLSHKHLQNGVSLTEILVGLAIMAILLAAGTPSFTSYIQNSEIRNAAEAIQNGLNLARSEAVRRNTGVQFVLGTGTSWTVGCATASTECPASIQVRNSLEGSRNAAVATSEIAAGTGAPAGTAAFTDTLAFNGFGRAAGIPAGNDAVFDISNPTGGICATANGKMRCLRIVVSQAGQIRMCDPALTLTKPNDPQAC